MGVSFDKLKGKVESLHEFNPMLGTRCLLYTSKRAVRPLFSGKTVVKIGFLCYNILAEYPQKAEKRRRTPSD